jgi:hypothetical protein
MKAADWPDPAAPEDAVDDTLDGDPNAPKWAGDLYEEGDETDPVEAFAAFTGDDGVTAWLDVAPDGTKTGWVKDGEEVYRYSDPNAWALDVDGAGMARAGELDTPEGEEPAEGEDPAAGPPADETTDPAADPAADPEAAADPAAEEDVQLDDSTGHDPNGDTPAIPGDGVAPENEGDGGEPEHEEHMDPQDDNFYTRMKKKGEKKSALAIHVRRVDE